MKKKIFVAWPLFLDSVRLLEERRPGTLEVFNTATTLCGYSSEEIVLAVVNCSDVAMNNRQVLALGGVRQLYRLPPQSPINKLGTGPADETHVSLISTNRRRSNDGINR